MSLGGKKTHSLNAAIDAAIDKVIIQQYYIYKCKNIIIKMLKVDLGMHGVGKKCRKHLGSNKAGDENNMWKRNIK